MCLKNMTTGMVPWYGLNMQWLKAEKVWFMSSCMPFINQTITEEVQCFWEGNHQDWRGIQISVLVCLLVFSYDQPTASNEVCSNLTFFRTHLQYLGDYVHFVGINARNSIQTIGAWNGAQERSGKTILVVFSNFSSLLQGMGKDFNGMRGNSQPQTRHLVGYQL